jgi:hypothetical protein
MTFPSHNPPSATHSRTSIHSHSLPLPPPPPPQVNNDMLCNLAAVVEYDDSKPGKFMGRFLRYAFIPGLSIAHPSILYDEVGSCRTWRGRALTSVPIPCSPPPPPPPLQVSDLYWMVSNINRDSMRRWNLKHSRIRWNPFTFCESERMGGGEECVRSGWWGERARGAVGKGIL